MFFENHVNNSQVDDIAAKVVANYIFGNNCTIDFNLFIDRLKHQFENINKVIKDYFASKILDKSMKMKVLTLDNPSYILSQQLLSLFYMSNSTFSNYDKMKLLYSNTDNALSFEKLALALISKSIFLMILKIFFFYFFLLLEIFKNLIIFLQNLFEKIKNKCFLF